MALLLRFTASVIALYITTSLGRALNPTFHALHFYLAPGMAGFTGTLVAALILGVANAVIRPILKLVSLPITCLTLGLFSVVINALLFWATGQITPGYHVRGAASAVFGTITMGFMGGLINSLLLSGREKLNRNTRSQRER